MKQGESFGVFDPSGAIRQAGIGELGIYHDGTRFISTFELAIDRRRPLLLGSTVRNDGVLVVELANPDIPEFANGPLERDSVHISATSFLWHATWYVRYRIHNYARRAIALDVALVFGADYRDVFEVRGMTRERRGNRLPSTVAPGVVTLGNLGLDDRRRMTRFELAPAPRHLTNARAEYTLQLAADGAAVIELRATFGTDALPEPLELDVALSRAIASAQHERPRLATSNERFDAWLDRSNADLQMMITQTEYGPYPYAGVPWFSTPFGRDGIITAQEMLWCEPELARGVLRFLAATQATQVEPERDAEPGKIVHEIRRGEMAALGEIPFGRYYGSIDATPLFVVLAADYWRRTADRAAIEALWPHVCAALAWLDEEGDVDRDGFIEYASRTSRGLVSQGWKDSRDAISHADGTLAEGPIALCEVQGYVFAARRAAAELARVLGHEEVARRHDAAADELRERFERAFWSDRLGTYVLALDGRKRPCEVRASNAGHLLWSGLASPERAARVVAALFAPTSFTGWGIRTLDASAARFNPISYHNGSIWPHDNAILAAGLARYGFKQECTRVLEAMFEASHHFELGRMPELFCGFSRHPSEGPTLYPVACSPQAWAAGAGFLLLQACLGLEIDAPRRRLVIARPQLPPCLEHVAIRGLRIGAATVDLACHRRTDDVSVQLERRDGTVEVVVLK